MSQQTFRAWLGGVVLTLLYLVAGCGSDSATHGWLIDENSGVASNSSRMESCRSGIKNSNEAFTEVSGGKWKRVLPALDQGNAIYQAEVSLDLSAEDADYWVVRVTQRVCSYAPDDLAVDGFWEINSSSEVPPDAPVEEDTSWLYRPVLGVSSEDSYVYGVGCNLPELDEEDLEWKPVRFLIKPGQWYTTETAGNLNPLQSKHRLNLWFDASLRSIPPGDEYSNKPVDYAQPLRIVMYWPTLNDPRKDVSPESTAHLSAICERNGLPSDTTTPGTRFDSAFVIQHIGPARLPVPAKEYLQSLYDSETPNR